MKATFKKELLKKYFSRMAKHHHGEFNLAMIYANGEKRDGNMKMYVDFLKLANEHLDAEKSYLEKLAAL